MTSSAAPFNILDALAAWARRFEKTLDSMLTPEADVPPRLAEAMRYAVLDGGKRIRPFIVTRGCELCGGTFEQAAPAAVALECVHAFSLVHDDLPAMDNDDLRRGRPTCHKAFGEAIAILAGDGLLALAFEILATRIPDPARAVQAVAELARGTGWAGMIAGQTNDMLGEGQTPDLALTRQIHLQKTARLFEAAGRLGAICAGANTPLGDALADYGRHLGRAFQIADDLLDVTGTADQMGKAVAKDADAGKQTYPAAVGVTASREAAQEAALSSVRALDVFGPSADDLRALARFVVERRK
ncbi:MAG TPA: polyprenyl synthetase family protein [Phycisphaerae bacterium]|jgi:geranylgeranyl diphosphate synthase type II|nr:polyprenyl synthetase family protein [Phycisphaerae bacterium]HOJ54265.1 polyprenyl synthetase family protein [Phycisphaerae bacterium]HOL26736.1 polyprenyl synthetase family protein [Phycisphaerae bacterium]HPP20622.1 polyprenyl synthetase family protein [Phycisphaerae bacterium]HPU34634.1 polyprenyl synthetase family protein [Phycisphaerae bacterium]